MNSYTFDVDFIRRTENELEKVEAEIKELEAIRQSLRSLLSKSKKSSPAQINFLNSEPESNQYDPENGTTIRERVLGVTKVLIEKNGKSARLSEIVDYIESHNIDMGESAKPRNLISSILSTEVKKGVLKKVRRGMYNFK